MATKSELENDMDIITEINQTDVGNNSSSMEMDDNITEGVRGPAVKKQDNYVDANNLEMARINQENNHYEHMNYNQIKPDIIGTMVGKRTLIMCTILVCVLLIYSVIISTIALIIGLRNGSSTESSQSSSSSLSSCHCTLNSLAENTESVGSNSAFCDIVYYCMDIKASDNQSINPTVTPTDIPSNNPLSLLPTKYPSMNPTINPSINPSPNPSNNPTINPSPNPSNNPTVNPSMTPSLNPSPSPTIQPTIQPTYFDGYFIGDFKFSLKNSDHGFWKLCNGDLLQIDGIYQSLFNEIGFMFGGYNDTNLNVTYFQLPNVSDSVLGIAGTNHLIGDIIGSETIILTDIELPSHRHFTNAGGTCTTDEVSGEDAVARNCPHITGNVDLGYTLGGHTATANTGPSSFTGSGAPFSLIQPTIFVGNLFIHSGVSL